jgi:restriction system protein
MAVALLGISASFWVLSLQFASSASPMLRPLGLGLRAPVPYAAVLGLLLLGLHFLIAKLATSPPPHVAGAQLTHPPSTRGDPASTMERPLAGAKIDPVLQQLTKADSWSERVFDSIEWRRFEAVCESLFAQASFTAKAQSHGADGGVDIWLYSRHTEGPAAVVQCKHWRGKPVGVKEVREFYGVMASQKLRRGTFATSSTFTPDALRFGKENGISLLDGRALLALISRRTPEQQDDLLRIAYEGDYWRPTCASCGIKMVERSPKKGGVAFWGCAQFPKCRATLPMRAA